MKVSGLSTQRKSGTDIHIKVRNLLDKVGLVYIEEYSLPPYRLDFFLPECNLGVEADSEYWHSERKDRARDEFIDGVYHIRVIRFGYNVTLEILKDSIMRECK